MEKLKSHFFRENTLKKHTNRWKNSYNKYDTLAITNYNP